MADIVISHATEDRDRAEILGRALSAQGLKVWMYRDILGGGGDRDEVNAKIRGATRVLALWTPAGCASQWVLEEARTAAQDHRLINVELLSGLTPRAFQAGLRIDLSGWQGQRNDPSLEPVAQAIATIVGKEEQQTEKRAGAASLAGKLFGRNDAVQEADAETQTKAAIARATGAPKAAAPVAASAAAPAQAAPDAPLKIEVFEKDKPRSTPDVKTRRWYELTAAQMFAAGLALSVVIGGAVFYVRNSFNSHPIAVAARAEAEQELAAAEEDVGYLGEPESVKFLKELGSSDVPLTAIAYGSNEWLQAIGDAKGSLRLIEADDGTLYSTLTTGGKAITDVAFDGGAEYVAASSVDGKVYVFRAGDGQKKEFTIGDSPVRQVAWHPSDVLIATGNDAGVLDIRSMLADEKGVKQQFESPITAMAWRGDGAIIALGFKSGAINFVDAKTGKVMFRSTGHLGQVNGLAFSPDRTTLASVGEDGLTKTWNADSGEPFLTIPSRPCAPEELDKDGHCPALAVTFSSPNGEVVLTSNQKGDVEGFNPKTGERFMRIRGHNAPVTGVGWSRYNHRITTIDASGKAAFWTSPFDKPWKQGDSPQ